MQQYNRLSSERPTPAFTARARWTPRTLSGEYGQGCDGSELPELRETSQSVYRRQTGLRELLESSCGGNAEVDGVCRQASKQRCRSSGQAKRRLGTRDGVREDETSMPSGQHERATSNTRDDSSKVCMPNDGITAGRDLRTYLSLDAQSAARRARQRGRQQLLRGSGASGSKGRARPG